MYIYAYNRITSDNALILFLRCLYCNFQFLNIVCIIKTKVYVPISDFCYSCSKRRSLFCHSDLSTLSVPDEVLPVTPCMQYIRSKPFIGLKRNTLTYFSGIYSTNAYYVFNLIFSFWLLYIVLIIVWTIRLRLDVGKSIQ